MNFLSINIQGVGVNGKAEWIRRVKQEFGVPFLAMQETMCGDLQVALLSNFWGGMGFDFDVVNSNGRSGGIACVWDPKVYIKDSVIKYENFLFVSGCLTEGNVRFNIINVYAPQQNVDKSRLWLKITQYIHTGQGWWIVLGDFNAVRNPQERKNSNFDPVCAKDFNGFIDEADLKEYNLKGMKYTFLASRGN
ncbi:uncharacterized protein LOC143577463 [Bidens hawaiensis]|uniref:uncharacterized protein LOC143577463 n=1 Tax=Bidens hawaiensis TaxID=980011 RepID=UPI00404AC550